MTHAPSFDIKGSPPARKRKLILWAARTTGIKADKTDDPDLRSWASTFEAVLDSRRIQRTTEP